MECDKLSMQTGDCIEALAVVALVGMQGMGTVGQRLHLGRGGGGGGVHLHRPQRDGDVGCQELL